MMAHATPIRHSSGLTRQQIVRRAVAARLAREDWNAMTTAANSSDQHVKSLSRWRKIAAEQNPHLNADQLDRQALRLRTEHFSAMANRRWANRTPGSADDAQKAA